MDPRFRWVLGAGMTLFLLYFAQTSGFASDPAIPPLEQKQISLFKPPEIYRHTLSNGIKLFFLKNHELPILKVGLLVEVGSVDDPEDKKGLTSLMMSAMRTGGSTKLSPDAVDESLEKLPAQVTVDANREYSEVTMELMSKDVGLVFPIFFDLLKNASFDPKRLELSRQSLLESIRRRNEKPVSVAQRKFLMQLYGENSPWARLATLETVSAISRQDVMENYKRMMLPQRMSIAVSGDIAQKELIHKLEKEIEGWNPPAGKKRQLSTVEKKWGPSIHFVGMPLNQSSIVLGHFGEKRFNPDKYALILANYILGGSTFASRLGNKIRTTMGLAYSIYSSFGLDTDYGAFSVVASTKTETTFQLIEEVRKTLKELIAAVPITDSELVVAKKTIISQLVFQYEETFNIVETEMQYDFFGYPPDYLMLFQKELQKVGLKRLREVMKEYFFSDRLKIVVVGNPDALKSLKTLGKVEILPAEDF